MEGIEAGVKGGRAPGLDPAWPEGECGHPQAAVIVAALAVAQRAVVGGVAFGPAIVGVEEDQRVAELAGLVEHADDPPELLVHRRAQPEQAAAFPVAHMMAYFASTEEAGRSTKLALAARFAFMS